MPTHTHAIVHEAQQLQSVSDRADSMAEQHPLVSEALFTISGSVRTATLLGGPPRQKCRRSPDQTQQVPDLLIALFESSVGIQVPKLVVKNDVEK